MKLTITEAIAKIKVLEKRIKKEKTRLEVGKIVKAIDVDSQENRNYLKELEAQFQSINDLTNNYMKIKAKIAESNASTKIKIGDLEMTIVEALERKNKLDDEISFWERLLSDYNELANRVEYNNEQVMETINKMLETKFSGESKTSAKDAIELKEQLYNADKYTLLTSDKVVKGIKNKVEELTEFAEQIDTKLSIVNATTYIEI